MRHRVIPYADSIGASYYKARLNIQFRHNWLRNNQRWIRKQMREEKEIVDIGPDEARRLAGKVSEYYEMERREILSRGYTLYRWAPQP